MPHSPINDEDSEQVVHTPKALRTVLESDSGSTAPRRWREANTLLTMTIRPLDSWELKWKARSMWYTDGSALKVDEAQRIGAGVYCAEADVARRIQCAGAGPTNTITRAELCAVYQCLIEEEFSLSDATIATDSKAIMHMIHNGTWDSSCNAENKHKTLISEIVRLMIDRARDGLSTTIVKVKSHIGIEGNEKADELAREAAMKEHGDDELVSIGGAFDGLNWLAVLQDGADTNDSQQRQSSPEGEVFLLSNLNAALKDAARPRFQTGLTNETQYVKIWENARPDLDLKASNYMWTSPHISAAALKQTLRVRCGVLHHMGQAFKMRRPYLPGLPIARTKACPLCGQEDSATHTLNACLHCVLKAMRIERHNGLGRMVFKEACTGAKGNYYIMADIGCSDKMQGLGTYETRISKKLLTEEAMAEAGVTDEILQKMRPDILIAPGFEMCRKRKRGNTAGAHVDTVRHIHIVEIGYTSEGRYQEKLAEKQEQHRRLVELLKASGYEVHVHNIIVGSTGGIFKASMADLESLGISKERCKRLARKIHEHSIFWLHNIIRKRRQLEYPILFRRGQRANTNYRTQQKKPRDR